STKVAAYEVVLKEIGFAPEPYMIADALMYADGKAIVEITDMSIRLTGATRKTIEALWREQHAAANNNTAPAAASVPAARRKVLFDYESILAYSTGNPSEAFGEPYKVFDNDRIIARLPGPPYQFLDRIVHLENAEAFKLRAGAIVEGEY